MPKKFHGENTKSATARAAKAAVQAEKVERAEKEKEDAYWHDDDKHAQKKLQRKEDRDKKKTEEQARKQELKQLHDAEMASVAGKSSTSSAPTKVTRAVLDTHQAELAAQAKAEEDRRALARKKLVVVDDTVPLEENVNRLHVDEAQARNVEEALDVLKDDSIITAASGVDRHVEKRLRAAYTAYEERRLKELKIDNPSLRLSQLKQLIQKEWQKSPDNPLNQQMIQVSGVMQDVAAVKSGDVSD